MIFYLFCTIDKPTLFIIISLKLNSVEIQGAYNSYTRVYTLPQTQIYSIQGVEAPSTMKLIKVCEYSLKVLGENGFTTNRINNLHIRYDQVCKTRHKKMYAKMYIQSVIKNILIYQLNPSNTNSHFNRKINLISNYQEVFLCISLRCWKYLKA
ncbi:unnamed protein product (macronuclear) [Paramecium tetraurelia]|uniref:Uncharacterized protein n=1 Tax=Paramecium tetraurelia TaxID=5888 RepID=A0CXH0_PARTE|nr:uncharacterized protein GSPATT00011119001 [Paramecium tetraurelia]CAK75487.1 unnamed protein product [Paramecium tetraurelia]|eukprot:XP_001442884.1 hypothetical protein (macronuclear) [Paramecium tetraurelia strain d4-2]